jgi:hypothetical protein
VRSLVCVEVLTYVRAASTVSYIHMREARDEATAEAEPGGYVPEKSSPLRFSPL